MFIAWDQWLSCLANGNFFFFLPPRKIPMKLQYYHDCYLTTCLMHRGFCRLFLWRQPSSFLFRRHIERHLLISNGLSVTRMPIKMTHFYYCYLFLHNEHQKWTISLNVSCWPIKTCTRLRYVIFVENFTMVLAKCYLPNHVHIHEYHSSAYAVHIYIFVHIVYVIPNLFLLCVRGFHITASVKVLGSILILYSNRVLCLRYNNGEKQVEYRVRFNS